MGELWECGAGELAAMIRAKQVSSVEVVEAHLARIDAVNPAVNAITEVLAERAVADATTCAIGTGEVLASTLAAANTLTFFTEDGVTYQVSAVGQLPGTGCS